MTESVYLGSVDMVVSVEHELQPRNDRIQRCCIRNVDMVVSVEHELQPYSEACR